MLDGYPFIFQMNDKSYSDDLLEYTMQYRFKSDKSIIPILSGLRSMLSILIA